MGSLFACFAPVNTLFPFLGHKGTINRPKVQDLVLCLKQEPSAEGEEQSGRGFLASLVGQLSKPFICRDPEASIDRALNFTLTCCLEKPLFLALQVVVISGHLAPAALSFRDGH